MRADEFGLVPWAVLTVAAAIYAATVHSLESIPRPMQKELLAVAVPAPVQVLLAGGDRYLAANMAVFRALVVGTQQLDGETYEILGRVQSDAARLNPAHEDNYYISQAILPWNGQILADVFIQNEATEARPWDSLPPFFLGFDKYYFLHDPIAGARSMRIAAERSPPGNRGSLTLMAARWSEKGDDPRVAVGLLEAMARNTRDRDLKRNIEARIERMNGLAELRDAARKFSETTGRAPATLSDLLGPELLARLPEDPLGQGFAIDGKGVPVVATRPPAKP